MSFMIIEWRESGATPAVLKKEMNKILKTVWRVTAEHWHRYQRPKHFTHAGAREYGYTPRSGEKGSTRTRFKGSYTQRKIQAVDHTRPLEFSGTSRQLTRIQNIKSTSKGAVIRMRAPALNFRAKGSAINMREELTAISAGDLTKLKRVANVAFTRQLRELEQRNGTRKLLPL